MKIDFTHTGPDNSRLILIFTGWSTGPETGDCISLPGWDTAVVHDYSDMTLDTSFLDRYYTVYLFAWSLGVFAAANSLPHQRITAAFAINGTTDPVDNSFGIPAAVYDGTASGLTVRNLTKFRMRMMSDRTAYDNASHLFPPVTESDIAGLSRQLVVIRQAHRNACVCPDNSYDGDLPWTRAYISSHDRIFPPENQKKAWKRDPDVETILLDEAHRVDIGRIVRSVISDPSKVSRQFTKASGSYDTHAIAQYSAAMKLAGLLEAGQPRRHGRILEIGCGTGLFTREYAPLLEPSQATFVDITETGPFRIAPKEEYVIEDAERWICRQTEQWDVILSASAIQWFADIPRFLAECNRRLAPGGILAISTFVPGNMEELDELRPSPLIYPKATQLREWMSRHFTEVQVVEDSIRVEFKSAREVLMHLKHTGVAGSAPSGSLQMSDMSHLRSLTYRPVYVFGRKRPSI